jgi:hypothetical protein
LTGLRIRNKEINSLNIYNKSRVSYDRGFIRLSITKNSFDLLNIYFGRLCQHELQLNPIVPSVILNLDSYYHNVSPRAYAKIL